MQTNCFFVSDLHGDEEKYFKLFRTIESERPEWVFLGGDLLPGLPQSMTLSVSPQDFIVDFLAQELQELRKKLGDKYPRIFLILGNDDEKSAESSVEKLEALGLWEYVHYRKVTAGRYLIYGYAYVPPTPFQLKDWERHDVSRYVEPGSVSPEEGMLSVPIAANVRKYSTIKRNLEELTGNEDLAKAVFLFHAPPHHTKLDRAALDGKMVNHAPLDPHVGSIAIRRFIESRQPRITLHGHIHESPSLTGSWKDKIGATHLLSAAHQGSELALVRFSPETPEAATRELL